MTNGNLHRRLAKLERCSQLMATETKVSALAMETEEGDLTLVGSEWRLFPDVTRSLAESARPIKV